MAMSPMLGLIGLCLLSLLILGGLWIKGRYRAYGFGLGKSKEGFAAKELLASVKPLNAGHEVLRISRQTSIRLFVGLQTTFPVAGSRSNLIPFSPELRVPSTATRRNPHNHFEFERIEPAASAQQRIGETEGRDSMLFSGEIFAPGLTKPDCRADLRIDFPDDFDEARGQPNQFLVVGRQHSGQVAGRRETPVANGRLVAAHHGIDKSVDAVRHFM